ASALLMLAAASGAGAQSLSLFPTPPPDPTAVGTDATTEDNVEVPGARRCVVIQCVTLPIPPAPKTFTLGTGLWTTTALATGIVVAAQGPIDNGSQGFRFVNERFFQYDTYAGGADKASHFVVSATVASLLSDAYRLNGLSENRAFALSLGVTLLVGVFVEIGDGMTRYGGSAQDLTADAAGALLGAMVTP